MYVNISNRILSLIENYVHGLLVEEHKVPVVCVCHAIPRGHSHYEAASFAERVGILQQYLEVVLSAIPNVFCWLHRAFSHPGKDFYLPDGVHVNPAGQYHLYRSYRGAIFRAVTATPTKYYEYKKKPNETKRSLLSERLRENCLQQRILISPCDR